MQQPLIRSVALSCYHNTKLMVQEKIITAFGDRRKKLIRMENRKWAMSITDEVDEELLLTSIIIMEEVDEEYY